MASLCAPADQVQQDERVERAEPQRRGRIGTAVPGQPGQRRRHQRDTEQGDQAHAEQSGRYLAAGQAGQRGGDGEEHRAVRRGGLLPHRCHLVGERAAELCGPVRVDVDVRVDHGALGEIAVHVPAEQRRGEQQRGRPRSQHEQQGARGGRFGAAYDLAEQCPRGDQQDDAEIHPDQPEYRAAGAGGEEVVRGQGAGRLTAQGEEGGAYQAQSLAAAEIDGVSLGQHLGSVSRVGGRKAT